MNGPLWSELKFVNGSGQIRHLNLPITLSNIKLKCILIKHLCTYFVWTLAPFLDIILISSLFLSVPTENRVFGSSQLVCFRSNKAQDFFTIVSNFASYAIHIFVNSIEYTTLFLSIRLNFWAEPLSFWFHSLILNHFATNYQC